MWVRIAAHENEMAANNRIAVNLNSDECGGLQDLLDRYQVCLAWLAQLAMVDLLEQHCKDSEQISQRFSTSTTMQS
jgi:hypothetical protein